jgi:hypothetical protein
MIEMKYLILSMENHFVYTMTPRSLCATAVVAGDGDSVIKGVTSGNSADFDKIKDRQQFYKDVWMVDQRTNSLSIVPWSQVSDSWKQQQKILVLRQDLFYSWETFTAGALARLTRYKWDQFDQLATRELDKCDPLANQYTMMLEEYARVMEVPVEQAYKELKLRIESDNIARFRITAMAEKWKNIINTITTSDESASVRKEMVREFWLNAAI